MNCHGRAIVQKKPHVGQDELDALTQQFDKRFADRTQCWTYHRRLLAIEHAQSIGVCPAYFNFFNHRLHTLLHQGWRIREFEKRVVQIPQSQRNGLGSRNCTLNDNFRVGGSTVSRNSAVQELLNMKFRARCS